jgi:hypothetical protein
MLPNAENWSWRRMPIVARNSEHKVYNYLDVTDMPTYGDWHKNIIEGNRVELCL